MNRRPTVEYSYRKRFLGISIREQQKLKKWKIILLASHLLSIENSDFTVDEINNLKVLSAYAYLRLRKEPVYNMAPCARMNRTIESFDEEECYRLFRFRKPDLKRLYNVLHVPEHVVLSNRTTVTGEEVFLVSLRRLSSTCPMQDLCFLFGRDYSQWSRAFKWFLHFIFDNYADLLLDNMSYWEPKFQDYSECVRKKVEELGVPFAEGDFSVCAFIDDHCFETCRPGGPTGSGINRPRADLLLQRAFYNGWKSHHGLKFQTVDLPNGMVMDMWGPRSLRHSDLNLLDWSDLPDRMRRVQGEAGRRRLKVIYGDSIFPWYQCLRSRHKGPNLTPREISENAVMTKVRVSIEWHYGEVGRLFPFTNYKKNLKLRKQPCGLIYFVASLFRNCHTCVYGNNTSKYFNCPPPQLENYIRRV